MLSACSPSSPPGHAQPVFPAPGLVAVSLPIHPSHHSPRRRAPLLCRSSGAGGEGSCGGPLGGSPIPNPHHHPQVLGPPAPLHHSCGREMRLAPGWGLGQPPESPYAPWCVTGAGDRLSQGQSRVSPSRQCPLCLGCASTAELGQETAVGKWGGHVTPWATRAKAP